MNEQLRFFKILEYTGRYGFPEILIEVRAAFLELALRKKARRMLAKNARKNFAPFRHSGTKNRVIGLETHSKFRCGMGLRDIDVSTYLDSLC